MSQQQKSFWNTSAGPMYFSVNQSNIFTPEEESKEAKPSTKRRECTGTIYDRLDSLIKVRQEGVPTATRSDARKNRNFILCTTIARLLKDVHIRGLTDSRNYNLLRGISPNLSSNEFIMIMRTDGRIIAISDEAERHLEKEMRLLYSQLINIFECLNETDSEYLRSIFESSNSSSTEEYRLICTLRLPKGRRPSRVNEDVKTIYMAGHFCSCHESSSEKLFIARCGTLLTPRTKGTNTNQSSTTFGNSDSSKSIMTITLSEDMTISNVSSNVKDILGYSNHEMIGKWFGRYLTFDDIEKFQSFQQTFFHHQESQQKATPLSVCEIFDLYAKNGDERLTFLFRMRVKHQRKSKTVDFELLAQVVDPLLRTEYMKYILNEPKPKSPMIEVSHVNLVTPTSSQQSSPHVMSSDPTDHIDGSVFSAGSNTSQLQSQSYFPFDGSSSYDAISSNYSDEFWNELFNNNCKQFKATKDDNDFDFWEDFWEDFCNNSFNTYGTTTHNYDYVNSRDALPVEASSILDTLDEFFCNASFS